MVSVAALAVAVVVSVAALAVAVVVSVAALVVLVGVEQAPVEPGGHARGLVLIAQGNGLSAQLGPSGAAEHVVEGEGGLAAGELELGVLALREGEAKVLEEVLRVEARCPVAVEDLRRKVGYGA